MAQAYNIAANQVLAQPVTAYYQGKALRAGIKQTELQNKGLQQEIDMAPEVEARKGREVAVKETKNAIDIAKLERDIGKDNFDYLRESVAGGLAVYDETQDETQAYEAMVQKLAVMDPNTDPEEARALLDEQTGGRFDAKSAKAFLMTSDEYLQRSRPSDATVAPTELQKTLEPLVKRGVITRQAADQLYLQSAQKSSTASASDTQKDRQIAELTEMLGGDRDLAMKIAYGLYEMKQNPVTGMVQITDTVTGTATEVPVSGEVVVRAEPTPGRTLWELSEFATGPESALKAGYNIPAAWVGLPVSTKTAEARQTFRTTNQNFIRALSINPRFPVSEQERIREEINILPALLDAPELLRIRMQSIHNDLSLRAQLAEADANNTKLPQATRGDALSAANEIRNYLAIMGVPRAETEVPDNVPAEARDLWPYMTEEQRNEYLNQGQ